ncbi:hypothetical protein REPUB_Repub01dG0236800 [Reevesia pubescens]
MFSDSGQSALHSSFRPILYTLPKRFPSKKDGRCEYDLNHVTRNTFYLVRLPGTNQTTLACWLVNILDGTNRVKMRILNALPDSELKPLPVNFPKVLDLTNFQVIELGHQYIASYTAWASGSLRDVSRYYIEKVALLRSKTGIDSPLENCPAYRNLFWPPPEWVTSPESLISSREIISNSTKSVPSATPDTEYKYPDSSSAICTREVGGKSPERVSAGREVGSKHPSRSSKCCFKFCCL